MTGQKLDAVNVLGLEPYLQGVITQEMPSAWPDEALKAQAVAARSYALAHRVSGKAFDLYADVRSQVYGGIAGEKWSYDGRGSGHKGAVLLWEGSRSTRSSTRPRRHDARRGRGLRDARPVPGRRRRPHSALSPVHRWGPVAVAETALRKGLKSGRQ